MPITRRAILLAAPSLLPLPGLLSRSLAQGAPLRCAVGPFQPTAGDTRRAYEPFFARLAAAVGRPLDLTVTTDWAGIAVALANGQVDCAWMGPWGYVLARDRAGAEALAVVEYQGKPTYHAIIIGRPELRIARFPEDAQGLSISFADAGSTSGWLIPHHWFKTRGIDPRRHFRYRDGASHAANVIAVANGQVDLATDYDRNLAAMVAAGRVRQEQVKVVWTSDPLPNDALAVRRDLDPEVKQALLAAALGIDADAAKAAMPANYTGWQRAAPDSYAIIEAAGRALGRLNGA
ncbi:phosphate/phosphite/phosphonate ABC transporter substrate-binding protein [Teichococcus vastitatis]|uniref:Phosphate/phosphite/phosphonate ABC transporter substrate-binding protein n=1 Tax=Teichococcus vastitatis TaxID=2307076 RepID=A0ABS9W7B1_9PROT|nr:phosphate/phosphite/phosphonate ABC transporter substrate-binding protein [Pseudoroseomonas vastitatis]MCI0755096.1 phosphate/phosphite/phosphonate ABC transporter substrate-binding protein [Pseudoroseomonas vastitatis]